MCALHDVTSTSQKRQNGSSGGLYLYAAGSIAAGILDLIWGDFEAAHQPIQALGDHIPGRTVLAYIAAIWLIAGGAAILTRRLARAGASALAVMYLIFAGFWLPRFYTAVHLLGFKIALIFGLSAGVGQQLILVAAAGIVHASPAKSDFRSGFVKFESPSPDSLDLRTLLDRLRIGASDRCAAGVGYGSQMDAFGRKFLGDTDRHCFRGLLALPSSHKFWTSWLPGCLPSCCSFLACSYLAPAPLARPHDHVAWGSNAYNLAAVGAAAMFAESIAIRRGSTGIRHGRRWS